MQVPWIDIKRQNSALRDEILPLWDRILTEAQFIGGEHLDGFEREFAAACGAAHCCAVSNGTDALRLIFHALDLQPGDEVITVPNTFIATTEAIVQAGGMPVFVDVDPQTCTMDPERLEAAITPRTRGVVPVHLYGQMADMDPILETARRHGLWVVEDAAQAHLAEYKGRRAGSIGDAAAFSFYPGKNLGACGEAGAVTTGSAELANRVRILRDHGQATKYFHDVNGYNNRCDALQTSALRVKLKYLPEWNERRRTHAAQYLEELRDTEGVTLPTVAPDRLPVWHVFVVQVDDRDRVHEELRERGVSTSFHYPLPLHLQQAYAWMGLERGSYPITEAMADRLLTLPLFPEMTSEQVAYVCEQLADVVAGARVQA